MNKRPIAVTILAYLLIVMGVVGIAYHFTSFGAPHRANISGCCLSGCWRLSAEYFCCAGKVGLAGWPWRGLHFM